MDVAPDGFRDWGFYLMMILKKNEEEETCLTETKSWSQLPPPFERHHSAQLVLLTKIFVRALMVAMMMVVRMVYSMQ